MNMEKLINQSVEMLAKINEVSAESIMLKIKGGCKSTESEVFNCSCAIMAANS